jgi:hypothetical protein
MLLFADFASFCFAVRTRHIPFDFMAISYSIQSDISIYKTGGMIKILSFRLF